MAADSGERTRPRISWAHLAAVGAGTIVLALALRSGISSFGVALQDLTAAGVLTTGQAGMLTTIPVVAFAAVGYASGPLLARLGAVLPALLAAALITAGLIVRVLAPIPPVIVSGTVLMLIGVAVGNIVLPVAIKQWFPDQLRTFSSIYASLVIAGSSLGALGTGALTDRGASWQAALGIWAVLPAVAIVPWLIALRARRHDRTSPPASRTTAIRAAAAPGAWWMALLFGMVFAQAYAQLGWFPTMLVDAGLSRLHSASMLALLTAVGVPTMLLLPLLTRALRHRSSIPLFFGATTVAGWLGMLLAPAAHPVLWAVLIGVGAGSFAWATSMIGQHARTTAGAARLSSFSQGLGFAIAGIGPLGAALLHQLSGGWAAPAILLAVIGGVLALAGIAVNRPWQIEDGKTRTVQDGPHQ